jgi:MFS superfamily sulfate permease-like transporter
MSVSSPVRREALARRARSLRSTATRWVAEMAEPARALIVDASGQDQLDLTTSEVVKSMHKELDAKGITTLVAGVRAPELERARASGMLDGVGDDRIFPTFDAAVVTAGSSGRRRRRADHAAEPQVTHRGLDRLR